MDDLLHAIITGRESEVRALVASGADVNGVGEYDDWTPLHNACMANHGSVGIVGILIEAGADVNQRAPIIDSDDAGQTPLLIAVLRGRHEIVKMLLAAGAGPNCDLSYRYAIRSGHRHTLRLMLQHRVPMYVPENWSRVIPYPGFRTRGCENMNVTWAYHDKIVAAGGWDAWVKKHREILASIVDKVVEAKFRRRAPKEVCAHVALFIAPPGGS